MSDLCIRKGSKVVRMHKVRVKGQKVTLWVRKRSKVFVSDLCIRKGSKVVGMHRSRVRRSLVLSSGYTKVRAVLRYLL